MKEKCFIVWIVLIWVCSRPIWAANYDSVYTQLPFPMEKPMMPVIPDLTVSLTEYGGKGDGETLNTHAFEKAISDLSQRGGGHLIVPEGVWVTGPIVMKSNIDLHVVKNAIVLFTSDKSQYPVLPPDEGISAFRCQSPVSAYHERNFSITGEGVFDGNGEYWRPVKRSKVSEIEWDRFLSRGGIAGKGGKIWYPWNLWNSPGDSCVADSPEKLSKVRPRLFRIVGCEQVLLQGVVFQNSPSFHVNFILCKDIIVDQVTVRCPWNAQNGDGIDFSSCENVLVTNASVDVGDDAICLKSGIGETGRRRGPCRNVLIDGCTVFHGHGGFVIGSDTGGGISNVVVRNCRFMNTDTGIRLKSLRGRGGLVENIYVENIRMNDIANYAIWFELFYQKETPVLETVPEGSEKTDAPWMAVNADTPCFRNICMSNITCTDADQAMFLNGLPEMNVQDIQITDCYISAQKGIRVNETSNLRMDRIVLAISDGDLATFNNVKDVHIHQLKARKQSGISVSGSRNRNIQVEGENISRQNVHTTPLASGSIIIID